MRSSRWWDLPATLLLLVALIIASSRLMATEWADHLRIGQVLVFLGMGAGLALGYSKFSPGLAALFAGLYGVVLVPWQLGITVGHISDNAMWTDRLTVLAGRLVSTLRRFVQQEPVQDPVLFLFMVAVLSWMLSVHASFVLTRRARPWRVILPTGLTTLLIHSADRYAPGRVWYLAAYATISFLLLARVTYLRLRQEWLQDGARVPPLMALDLSYAALAISVLVVLVAWAAPGITDVVPAAREVWQRSTRPVADGLERLFASLRRRGPVLTVEDYYAGTFSLGQGRELGDALVLGVQGFPTDQRVPRYYWRARVYDYYDDGKWSSGAFTTTEKVDGDDFGLSLPGVEGREPITFAFTSPEPLVTLYAVPQPVWVNKPVEVLKAENPGNTVDVAALRSDPPLSPGETYLARSYASAVTRRQLRNAGTDYPEWVTDRYLELPPTVTPRTRELAQELAAGLENPYDVAALITEYLRLQIRYSETIAETVPAGQEPLDWFLFDLQVGYCNYYASAEVILLRSVGIPARLAVGFAEGERRAATNTYLVHQKDAHAWPEVFFPQLGWIEFEPTVSQARLIRPSGETGLATDSSSEDDADMGFRDRLEEMLALEEEEELPADQPGAQPRTGLERWIGYAVLPLMVMILLALAAWWWRRQPVARPLPVVLEMGIRRIGWRPPALLQRWAQRAMLSPMERAYGEVDRALMRLGASPAPADTPAERAAALAALLPIASESAYLLLSEYQTAIYSSHRCSEQVAHEAARSIRSLSWQAKLRQLIG